MKMKRIILTVMTLVLTLALCACKGGDSTTASGSGNGGLAPNTSAQGAGDNQPAGNKPSNVKPSAEKPSGDNQPATNDPGIDDGQGAPTYDDMPSGVDYMIAEDVYYYELYMLEGDSGEGLTTLDGAYLVNDLMIDLGFY
ncbi:MAG: hypothetical protein LBM60_04085, partial [Clostridium sp.]|nr:hypothetical protein [Clostridium sp.]